MKSLYLYALYRDILKLKEYFWSNSYCLITTGGATIDIVKKYIENQGMKESE